MNLEMFTSIVFYSFGVLVIRDLELVTIEIMHHAYGSGTVYNGHPQNQAIVRKWSA